jgi:hypothetical protein
MSLPTKRLNNMQKLDQSSKLTPLNIIRTETVLSKLPIHNLSKKGKIKIHITRKQNNSEHSLLWDVTPNPAYGEPRQLAYKLDTLVINRRIDEVGRPVPEIVHLGSLRDMAKELSLGNNTPEVKKALRQNAHAVIKVKLQYTDKKGVEQEAEFESTRYGVIFTGEKLPTGQKADAVYLVLNPPYRQVLNSAPVRPLDYTYIKMLPPTAQRFYELLSYRMFTAIKYGHPHARLLYSEYSMLSAQERYYDYDHFKKQMWKIHRPHRLSGYIADVTYEATLDQEGKADWLMHYTPGRKAKAEYNTFNRRDSSADAAELPSPQDASTDQNAAPAPAEQLVAIFQQLFHNASKPYASQKELDQAYTLITLHGFDRAKYIVEYSHSAAAETKYTPRTFGGILQYVAAALATFDEEQKRREVTASIQACKECNSAGFLTFKEANGHIFTTRCPHDLRMIEAREQREGLTRLL